MRKLLKNMFGRSDNPDSPPVSSQENPKKRLRGPSTTQIKRCEWLGLEIKPGMSSREIWLMVNEAKKDPRIKALDEEFLEQQWALQEEEDRALYGDVVIDNFKRMQALCRSGVQHIVVFKNGNKVDADVFEFESVSIDKNNQKTTVTVEACRPKIHKSLGKSPRIEWSKEVEIELDQILEIETLPAGIDPFDLDGFEKAQERANQLKEKYIQK